MNFLNTIQRKKNKLIIELEDKCNEQNEEMNIIIDKIKNIKKFNGIHIRGENYPFD